MSKTESNVLFDINEKYALTLSYAGMAYSCTATVGSNNLTIARIVKGITLGVKGTVGTANCTVNSKTLTLARATINGISVLYSGEGTVKIKVDKVNKKMVLTVGATATEFDLEAEDNLTIGKLVAEANKVNEEVVFSIVTGANSSCPSMGLDALAEFTLVQDEAKILTYTPANLVYDLEDVKYNTVAKLVAVINAHPELTCSMEAPTPPTLATKLLDNVGSTSFKTGHTLVYTPANSVFDLTHADNLRLENLIAKLNEHEGITAKLNANSGLILSQRLKDKVGTSILAPLTLEYSSATVISNSAYHDIGHPIGTMGHDGIAIFMKVDINNTQDLRIKVQGRYELNGDNYILDHSLVSGTLFATSTNKDYVELVVDLDNNLVLLIPDLMGMKQIQLQLSAGTVGATPGKIDDIRYTLLRSD